ncbi:FixH family protein [Bacillota bacterium Lsc_1132]
MRKFNFILLALLLVILTSCNQRTEKKDHVPEMLNVDLSVQPAKGQVNQPVIFEAKVTQGAEQVNDADKVTFEIWRSKDPKHEKINIKNPKNGIYRLEKSFGQEGTYYIISHVTARGLHNMPKIEFVIGNRSEPEKSNKTTFFSRSLNFLAKE